MTFLLFLSTLLHVAAGLLFCGLPLIALVELFKVKNIGRQVAAESLLHSLGFGVASLLIGSLMAGAQWDSSFDNVWQILGNRWLFLFAEMAFSMIAIGAVFYIIQNRFSSRPWRITSLILLFLAATNSLYHFPSLMVLTRELRRHPELYEVGQSMASLIFSPNLFIRWIHLAIAAVLISAVWHRLISSWFFHGTAVRLTRLAQQQRENEERTIMASPEIVELREIDWRGGVWAMIAIVGLWVTGFLMFLVISPLQVTQLTSLTSGKSNQLMLGVVLATFVGVRCLANSTRPHRGMCVLDVSLLLVTIAAMIDAVSRA